MGLWKRRKPTDVAKAVTGERGVMPAGSLRVGRISAVTLGIVVGGSAGSLWVEVDGLWMPTVAAGGSVSGLGYTAGRLVVYWRQGSTGIALGVILP